MRAAAPTLLLVPIVLGVTAAAALGAGTVTYNTYWGDLHGHTMESPVTLTTATVDAYILYARDTKGLHFVALTEKDFDLSDAEWNDCRARAAAYTSSSFVAFSAFEWGDDAYGDFGHRPVYYATDNQPLLRSEVAATDHVSELLDVVLAGNNGFTAIAHPDLSNYRTDWNYFDGMCDRVAEIYSRHGHYEEGTNGLQQALAQGYRFGFTAVGDSRTAQPGTHGLTAVLATSLTKSALHAAVKARRTYATTGARIVLRVTADGHEMGEEYTSSTGPTFTVNCTPAAALQRIEILKNNVVVYTYAPAASSPEPESSPWRPAPGTDGTAKSGQAVRLVRSVRLAEVPQGAVLRTNLAGDYRLWLNGELLVDTHTHRHDDPTRPHDCSAPDAHELVGTPEWFRRLGFYDVATLGGRLAAGENVLALELDPSTPQPEAPEVQLVPSPAVAPVSFLWADNQFSGASYYYVRITQSDGHQAWGSPIWVDRMAPDTTPPLAPARLRAHKDASDVYLDWSKVTKDVAGNVETISMYRIFRGPTSDFVPDRTGLSNQVGTSAKGRFRDVGALAGGTNYYYRIAAVDAANNESAGHSNLAYKLHHPLAFHGGLSNIHWLSLPYQAVYSNAAELARDLNRDTTGPFTKVLRWDPVTQRPASYVNLSGQWMGTNFNLAPGAAVAVTINTSADAILVGAHEEGTPVRLTTTVPGVRSLNWVGLPVHALHQLAYQVVQDANNGFYPGPVTRIVRFHPDLQTTQTYQWTGSSWSGTNFVILPGEAYGLEVQTTTDWVPDTLP